MLRDRSHRAGEFSPGSAGWPAALLTIAVLLTYANSLHGPFVLDDEAAIAQNLQIRTWSPGNVLLPEAESPVAGRPLLNLSFALNYAAGGLDVRGYHVVNIGLHLACALLAFGLIRRTLRLPSVQGRFTRSADAIAFVSALVWAVHPLNSEVVDYLTQRSESLMAAFFLLTLYAANRALSASRPAPWQAAAVLSCALGMLSKESMATAPVVVALYDSTLAFGSVKEALRRRTGLYLGLAFTWLALAAVLLSAPRTGSVGLSSGVSPWVYLLNQTEVITRYLRLSLWPDTLVVFYGWPALLTLRDVLPFALGLCAAAAATAVALVRAPALGFLGASFFITLAPASSVVPIATEVGAERRMYLPLLAVVVLLVLASHEIWKRWSAGRHSRRFVVAPLIVLIAVTSALAATTIARNREYGSGISLAQSVVDRRPTSIAYHILGEQFLLAARDAEAVSPLTEAVSRGDSRAGYFLGVALSNVGQQDEALRRLDAFVRTSGLPYRLVPRWLEPPRTEVVSARLLMARILATRREWNRAGEQAEEALKLAPADADARRLLVQVLVNVGLARVSAGDIDAAIDAFRRATELDPANAGARNLLAIALKDQQLAASRPQQ